MSETWGVLASPPKDWVFLSRWRRARRLAKMRQHLRDEENCKIFAALAQSARDEGWYSRL